MVLVENEVSIQIKLNNLIIRKEEKDIWIPVDDITLLVIDNMKITVTTRMLSFLAEHNVAVVFCNQEHLPIGFYSSYDNHSRISKTIKYQINASSEFYDEIWKEIIQAKIRNQKNVLVRLEKDKKIISAIEKYYEEVDAGDSKNREAHVAKIYFNELMGCTFSRGNEDILLNSGLDYGYAIIRSYLAKLCVGYGLNTQLGIHHRNEYNRFNLVDDLMEPFRPFVDYFAYCILQDEKYFKGEHRRQLVNLLNHYLVYHNKKMYLCNALEEYVANVAAVIAGRKGELIFPDIMQYKGEMDEI